MNGTAAGCAALQGIFVDERGMVAEGPNMNLGIITNSNELVVSSHYLLLLPNITWFMVFSTCRQQILRHHASARGRHGIVQGAQCGNTAVR